MAALVIAAAAAAFVFRSESRDAAAGRAATPQEAAPTPTSPVGHSPAEVPPAATAPATQRPVAPGVPARGALPPLPLVDYPAPRAPELIRAVYEFAARHPEILTYVPCFCGCELHGHRGSADCFVASRDAEGHVTWTGHGMG